MEHRDSLPEKEGEALSTQNYEFLFRISLFVCWIMLLFTHHFIPLGTYVFGAGVRYCGCS